MKIDIFLNGCIREYPLVAKLINSIQEDEMLNFTDNLKEADYIVYITCGGVEDTITKCLNELYDVNRLKKDGATLIIVGCLTRMNDILRNFHDDRAIKIIQNKDWIVPLYNYIYGMNQRNSYKTRLENRTRYMYNNNASIQFFIEDGCSNRCTFCKTNYNNSKVESVPYDMLLSYLRKLIHKGTRCITLGGDNSTLYGIDLYNKPMLHQLIHDLSLEEGLWKLAVLELTTRNMYPELLEELMHSPKVQQVSMQLETASDRLLKKMGRGHNLEEYDFYIAKLQEAGKNIHTILMSGFPTETQDDLDYTIEYLKERKIVCSYICEYCNSPYIPSNLYEQLPEKVKREHTKYLKNALNQNNYNIFSDRVGIEEEMILIGNSKGYYIFEDGSNRRLLSKSNRFRELDLGSLCHEKIKRYVKTTAYNGCGAYKI